MQTARFVYYFIYYFMYFMYYFLYLHIFYISSISCFYTEMYKSQDVHKLLTSHFYLFIYQWKNSKNLLAE